MHTEESFFQEHSVKIGGMYHDWFLDYASYVILERAIPSIYDGLKPVQRRILHGMQELEDGRYNKVANIIGHTMKYHPHGDASICDAIVQLGQRDLLIDTQGNWGNIYTGDRAAAARYIEARLTPFAREVVFSPKVTHWGLSYDGRNREPITLPVKFPLLLAQGVEGIAVGLSTRILPHNFVELLDAAIAHLKGENFTLYPDFPTGAMADVAQYNDGKRGGKVKVRASIKIVDKQTLSITEIPFGTNTSSLIDSILKANDKGKIKIKKIDDNTAEKVDIRIYLAPGISPDKTIDALYAFTDCQVSLSPMACVIVDQKPVFMGVGDMLRKHTDHSISLMKRELEISQEELENQWHAASLERLFIEKRIYRNIEEESSWEAVLLAIEKGLKPYASTLRKAITKDDLVRLTEIRIKRISRFDLEKAQKQIEDIELELKQVAHHLSNLIAYCIAYYKGLKQKYGSNQTRKTQLKTFDAIEATEVAIANTKLYVNKDEGFVGTSLKKDDFAFECSDMDDVVVFLKNGQMIVTKVSEKSFVGKPIVHVGLLKKNDTRTIYNLIYRDGKQGSSYMKRFWVSGVTRDKVYDLTQGNPHSELLYFSANPNGQAESVTVFLRPIQRLKKLKIELDFANMAIKGRSAKGNLVSRYPIKKIELKQAGVSTLAPVDLWFDDITNRLNTDKRGTFLGAFSKDDKILSINSKGVARLLSFDLSHHFEEGLLILEKWIPEKPITTVYYDGSKKCYYIKRFLLENTEQLQPFYFLEDNHSFLDWVGSDYRAVLKVSYKDKKGKTEQHESFPAEQVRIKGIKAQGNRLPFNDIYTIEALDPLPYVSVDAARGIEIQEDSNKETSKTTPLDEGTQIIIEFD